MNLSAAIYVVWKSVFIALIRKECVISFKNYYKGKPLIIQFSNAWITGF